LERFKSSYGSLPVVLAHIWEDLQTTTIPEAKINRAATKHFDRCLMAFYFLKVYPTEKREAGIFNVDEKTGRKWRWYFVEKVRALKKQKIVWPEEWEDDDSPIFIYSVDGTHAQVSEPRHPTMSKNPKYYSHKNKKPALTYELALSLWESRLVWINGPMKASVHDLTVFRKRDGLKDKTPVGKKGIGDLGYRGEKVSSAHLVRRIHRASVTLKVAPDPDRRLLMLELSSTRSWIHGSATNSKSMRLPSRHAV